MATTPFPTHVPSQAATCSAIRPAGAVVAGVGGASSTNGSLAAVRWAADEAVARGVPLRLVHADLWPTLRAPAADAPAQRQQAHLVVSRRALATAVGAALDQQPTVDVDTDLSPIAALDLLHAESESASMLVIGSRPADEPGGSGGMFSGALAAALIGRAHCPVAIIPAGPFPPAGPIVLGVDGSPASAAAARLAFETAARLGADVIAVHATNDTAGHVSSAALSADHDDHHRVVARALDTARATHPDVTVIERHTHDRPVPSLLDAADGARLVVVGARGHGGFAGMLLGSTSRALVHHCPAPLIVACAS